MRKRRYCPTGKIKYFNEAWGKIAAQEQTEKYDAPYGTYKCVCGWWHTYTVLKRRVKYEQRESRNARRRRAKRGEPPPLQVLLEQERREKKRLAQLRQRRRAELPMRVWEDDGGLCVWDRGTEG